MGKKSKNPSKQGGGKKSMSVSTSTSTSECVSECASAAAYRTAQQLQAGISSLSMNDAFAAVRLATQSIAQMKEEQQRAAQQLQCAREAVAQQQSQLDENKHHNDLYADKDFWEKRYQEEETSTSATATLTHTATATVTDLYEWYLDFTELSPLLIPDIEKARRQIELHVSTHAVVKVAAGEVLVAGCGNSSMCEDLHLAGVQGVCGMDYSRSVIDAMNKRLDTPALAAAKAGGVRYLQADGTAMPGHMKCTCSAVVDKGTLDAITSGGVAEGGSGGNNAAGTRDALAYMREMWAVLQPGGVLIIVSTMPPHLFHLVGSEVVPSLVNEADTADQHHRTRQGSGYRINSFITKEGGNVFYYTLFKPESKHTSKCTA
jgi:SAM-dependent methyltransferase